MTCVRSTRELTPMIRILYLNNGGLLLGLPHVTICRSTTNLHSLFGCVSGKSKHAKSKPSRTLWAMGGRLWAKSYGTQLGLCKLYYMYAIYGAVKLCSICVYYIL